MNSQFDSKEFRTVLGHFPTGVVIVSGLDKSGKPQGLTIGSFSSISLDPPLVGFFPGLNSASWPAIAESGAFCVNVLAASQGELCWRFAKESDDRYEGVKWSHSPLKSPMIDGCVAYIDCKVESSSQIGDHLFVVGRAESLQAVAGAGSPMVFSKGAVVTTSPLS
jgi:3-hydroxy-9,10-secoandrosta-1,3,5(10)-triene-9,17-dione monooxygenase reductase component